jgi:hypothetical protein
LELYGACCILDVALDADCLESMVGRKCDFGAPASQAHRALRGCVQTTTGTASPSCLVFACRKDGNGRCQLVEDGEQCQGQHLSPHEQHHRGGGGIEPSFCPRLGAVKPALWSAVDTVLSALLSCVEEGASRCFTRSPLKRLTRPTRCRSELSSLADGVVPRFEPQRQIQDGCKGWV